MTEQHLISRTRIAAVIGGAFMLLTGHVALAGDLPAYINPPSLDEAVAQGELPPVSERLPLTPRVTDPTETGRDFGRSGGRLSMLMSRDKDVRQMVVYGYARLVAYDEDFNIRPDILESVEVKDERVFTLHLRPVIAGPTGSRSRLRISASTGKILRSTSWSARAARQRSCASMTSCRCSR